MRKSIPERFFYPAVISLILFFAFTIGKKINFGVFSDAAAGTQKNVSSFITGVKDTVRAIRFAAIEKKKANEMIARSKQLEAENTALRAENGRLKSAVKNRQSFDWTGIVRAYARVSGANTDGFIQYFMIDAGEEQGVTEGDGVIAGGLVLGRVIKPMKEMSLVQLITDAQSSISVRIERSRVIGILTGTGPGSCEIGFVAREADVQQGDVVVTSGLSKSFPEGFKVGTVSLADKKAGGLSLKINVKPYADIFSTEDVIVIKGK